MVSTSGAAGDTERACFERVQTLVEFPPLRQRGRAREGAQHGNAPEPKLARETCGKTRLAMR
jgi:hypothetical protein